VFNALRLFARQPPRVVAVLTAAAWLSCASTADAQVAIKLDSASVAKKKETSAEKKEISSSALRTGDPKVTIFNDGSAFWIVSDTISRCSTAEPVN